MPVTLSHVQINVDPAHLGFYREFFAHCGWQTLHDADGVLGVGATNDTSLWFVPQARTGANDRDAAGVNHLAVGAESERGVDDAVAWLRGRGVECLFETPRHRPEFTMGPEETYYQVMFASPDGVLFEVVYMGPKGS